MSQQVFVRTMDLPTKEVSYKAYVGKWGSSWRVVTVPVGRGHHPRKFNIGINEEIVYDVYERSVKHQEPLGGKVVDEWEGQLMSENVLVSLRVLHLKDDSDHLMSRLARSRHSRYACIEGWNEAITHFDGPILETALAQVLLMDYFEHELLVPVDELELWNW